MPAIGTLDYPAPWDPLDAPHHRGLSTSAGVTDDGPLLDTVIDDLVIVAFVEAKVDRAKPGPRGISPCCVEGRQRHPHIVDIRTTDCDGEGYTTSIGQDMPLGARFGPIRRVGACVVPALGCLHRGRVHGAPLPVDLHFGIIVLEHGLHDPLEQTAGRPFAEATMTRRTRTELRGECLPLAPRTQTVKNTC